MKSTEGVFDIVVIGAGLVGLALIKLIRQELPDQKLALIEARSIDLEQCDLIGHRPNAEDVNCYQQRVSAITPASEQFFKALSVWSQIKPFATPFSGMEVRESDGVGAIELDSTTAGEERMGHIVENQIIESVLLKALATELRSEYSKITLFTSTTVSSISSDQEGQRQLILSSGDVIKTGLVIAADGAHSATRKLLGIPVVEWDYKTSSIVATVKMSKPHRAVARQIFTPTGPLALLPLAVKPENALVSLVWSLESDAAKAHFALSEQEFKSALAIACEYWLGDVESISERKMIPLWQRHAKNYTASCVALVGDAAHVIHPLAGQGVNLGFKDVAVLVEELVKAERACVALGDPRVLRKYERRRVGDNLAMMAGMELFKRFYEADSMPVRVMRNWGMRKINRLEGVKAYLMKYAMGQERDSSCYMKKNLSI